MDRTAEEQRDPALQRLDALVDGVFAIALTLLAVELRLPEADEGAAGRDLLDRLLDTWPRVFSFLLSFFSLAIYWTGHYRLARYILRSDGRLVWLTLLQLLCVGFLPFPTAVLGTHFGDPVATSFYYATLLVTGIVAWTTWRYASHERRLVSQDLPDRVVRHHLVVPLAAVLVFLVVAIVSAFGRTAATVATVLSYVALLVFLLLSVRDWWEPE